MMLEPILKVYLSLHPCDMRKQIDGLSTIVSALFEWDPFTESLFVFCNRKCDKVKILRWDHNGWWLYYHHLSKGTFRWQFDQNESILEVSERQLR